MQFSTSTVFISVMLASYSLQFPLALFKRQEQVSTGSELDVSASGSEVEVKDESINEDLTKRLTEHNLLSNDDSSKAAAAGSSEASFIGMLF
ncbi:unnamed protein product [Ambrosiozyma monospora]|uniref:Unnamed protein product n=1 Tax=Ambrosiozyma monospora TaxID=43982 RepID=A0ACB5U0M1_AMBMO|nr:unnamed protein product [Ambrosiozyma monospora]